MDCFLQTVTLQDATQAVEDLLHESQPVLNVDAVVHGGRQSCVFSYGCLVGLEHVEGTDGIKDCRSGCPIDAQLQDVVDVGDLSHELGGQEVEVGLQVKEEFVPISVAFGIVEDGVHIGTFKVVPDSRIPRRHLQSTVESIEFVTHVYIAVLLCNGGVQCFAEEYHYQQSALPHVVHHSWKLIKIGTLC